MAIILPPRATTDFRLLCSDCRKRNGGDDGLICLFEEYTSPSDPAVTEVHFELRERDGGLERREPGQAWIPYTGKVVLCIGCLRHSNGQIFVIFDPETKQQVEP